jgi:hypothetical protein
MFVDFNSPEGQEAFRKSCWMEIPDEEYRAATEALNASMKQPAVHSSMKNFDKWLNACEDIKYLESVTKEGDTYTLIGCGKSLQIKERFNEDGGREVLLWSKSAPTELRKVIGASLEKVLPRLVVQHFTGVKNVMYTDHENHKHIYEDVGFFPVSVHNNMTRFSDATGRKWMCIASGSDVPNITLAFYKLLYDGRTDMSAMMMPNLIPLDDVKLLKSGVGGKQVEVYELPEMPEPSADFVVSSVDDFKRALPDLQELVLFPHQGDVPDYGYSVFKDSGMVVSSADRQFIAGAEKTIREFIGSAKADEIPWWGGEPKPPRRGDDYHDGNWGKRMGSGTTLCLEEKKILARAEQLFHEGKDRIEVETILQEEFNDSSYISDVLSYADKTPGF